MKRTVQVAERVTLEGGLDADQPTPNRRFESSDRGQAAYEADVAKYPHYHDGKPRRKWSQLSKLAKSRW